MDLVYFVGRFHVLVLHLPIGIIVLAIVLAWIGRGEKHRQLDAAVPWLWAAAALTAIVTAVLGYMHFAEGGFDSRAASLHRAYGTGVAVMATAIWLLHSRRAALYRRLQIPASLLLLATVTLAGHYGGKLTHGSGFLVEYAPQPLRAFAGLPPRRGPVVELALADPYHDVVAPMLRVHCEGCHNADKRRGGLDLSDYEAIRAGGESGPAMVPGDAQDSEMLRRVSLPERDEDFMPAEGKTPLTADQVAILRWWIVAGAPIDVPLADIADSGSIASTLARELGLATGASQPAVAAADPAAVRLLQEAGFLVRKVSQEDNHLIVENPSPGRDLGTTELELLAAIADQLVELNLADSGIDDAEVAAIAPLASLRRLRLSNNQVTDRGVAAIAALPALESLNVYGNPGISDASIEALAAMPALARLHVWQTGIGAEGLARLVQMRPDLNVPVYAPSGRADDAQ